MRFPASVLPWAGLFPNVLPRGGNHPFKYISWQLPHCSSSFQLLTGSPNQRFRVLFLAPVNPLAWGSTREAKDCTQPSGSVTGAPEVKVGDKQLEAQRSHQPIREAEVTQAELVPLWDHSQTLGGGPGATAGHTLEGPGMRRREGAHTPELTGSHCACLVTAAPHALALRMSRPRPPCHLTLHLQIPLLANGGKGILGKASLAPPTTE